MRVSSKYESESMKARSLPVFVLSLWAGFAPSSLPAQTAIQKMMARISEEASAFQHLAPQVLGKETLHQRALKPPGRFRPRVGAAAMAAPQPTWKEREIVSQYGFTSF